MSPPARVPRAQQDEGRQPAIFAHTKFTPPPQRYFHSIFRIS